MIRLADSSSRQEVWNMWKTVFGDPDNYMNLYFRDKYKDENTLIYFENERAVASLQMLEFQFTFHGSEIPIYYLSGVCTLPEARKKGYMDLLLKKSFDVAHSRGISLMLLVPQEQWLLGFYNKYGFAQAFDAGSTPLISLRELNDKYPGDLVSAYKEFDSHFRMQDMTVQKTYDDFKTIMEENAMWDYPSKNTLIGMARVIDIEKLLSLYAANNESHTVIIEVNDEIQTYNNGCYKIKSRNVNKINSDVEQDFTFDVIELAQILLGYDMSSKPEILQSLFPQKNPQIHFMLE